MKLALVALIALTFCGCAASTGTPYSERKAALYSTDIAAALDGKVAGKPQSCISLNDARGTEQIGDKTILYRVNRKLLYRNDLQGGCPGLGRDRALVTNIFSSQLCRGDIVTPTDLVSGFSSGACALGDFVPYRDNEGGG